MKAAFEGLTVLDFSWVIAGPLITKYFADHGASVIRIESFKRPDTERTNPPFRDGIAGVNRSGYFATFNSNKLSMSLNLNHPGGREIAKQLAVWADIVVENFTPGVMERWGLSYRDMEAVNPRVIMLSASLYGQTGPYSAMQGFGMHTSSVAGFVHFTGRPDQPYAQPIGPYCDIVAPYFGAAALLGALAYRNRTGRGQYVDLSQYESSLHFMATPLLDFQLNDNPGERTGNVSQDKAPHGVYRCRGADRWCAIAVNEEQEWHALCEAFCAPGWSEDARFGSMEQRKRNEDELDRLVEERTTEHTAEEVFGMLCEAAVPCGIVQTASDLLGDPQLKHRRLYWEIEHPEIGKMHYLGQPAVLSATPACPRRPSPCLGEHTRQICREVLRMPEERFKELAKEGVFD